MIPFRERNPVPIAITGIVVLLGGLYMSFNAQNLPIIGGGAKYEADFADASGLKPGDDVRVAGVKVGEVDGLEIAQRVVRVSFRVKGADLGDRTGAEIKIKTLLGEKYLALKPAGTGDLDDPIPLDRTRTPFDVTSAFEGLAQTIEEIDTAQLAKAFDTLSETFADTPDSVRSSLRGLQRLSQTIATRDTQLASLLTRADDVTQVLADRNAEVVRLIDDGDLVLRTVQQQRAVIHDLLVNTARLADQLGKLVAENQRILGPALTNLQRTLAILNDSEVRLDRTIHLLAPFVRDFANTLGNGRWFDVFVANLPPTNSSIGPNTAAAP